MVKYFCHLRIVDTSAEISAMISGVRGGGGGGGKGYIYDFLVCFEFILKGKNLLPY